MISFIVPAHNEHAGIGRTLQAIHESARVVGQPYEIIVVDDASTDATEEIARPAPCDRSAGQHRQIAATRNSGGRAARGERLFFVDADTTINPRAVASALRCMDKGAVGGGAPTLFEGVVPLYIRLVAVLGIIGAKLAGFTGGAFMFCTREAFQATGGFDERFYWAEEGMFAPGVKTGRPVCRALETRYHFRTPFSVRYRTAIAGLHRPPRFFPFKTFTRRSSVEKSGMIQIAKTTTKRPIHSRLEYPTASSY